MSGRPSGSRSSDATPKGSRGDTREVGNGGVTYFALGHCHNPAIRAARADDPTDTTPLTFRGSWETDAFIALLRNAIAWGVRA